MKVILLAGGFGTRLSEYTDVIPKPMVSIGGKPILWHIMKTYANFGHKDFYVALGYKAEIIKDYFLNYRALNSDFTVDLSSGEISPHQNDEVDWKITLVNTGESSMTGGRVKRLQKFIGKESCMLTYGDGVADINLDRLLAFHRSHGKMVTISAVRPGARFGELEINGDKVNSFKEKPQLHEGWINGGYFIFEPSFFDYIDGDNTLLEREPLEKAVQAGELMAYRHDGFWHCMDTKRDHELLESLWAKGAPWVL
ncbi:glucose-1-phosphate cytidylyltransferase [Candidatus Methylopumilus rimovensis]|uniref:Glucose-1-phosphate cytidylyltransferase n=1 Tax=Candidatus Methylopumilus rimovensis TaxID=2588535 RepID=A0AAF1D7K3_9PROT|nr:glucose-1-phosphate cytidylyltransferase [Candidatus Methylopumilus rimovensis]QDD13378.1 glucose-1-phosphate cytidylyltransferase [Candidatus Methylopumilus rimovensis]